MQIQSPTNPKIKHLKKLNQKKYRDQFSEFLVENFTTIKDSDVKPKDIFVTQKLLDKHTLKYKNYYLIDQKTNKSFSNLDTPSGIVAIYDKPTNKINFKKSIIYLNNISDPGNLGTILRSALAFNLENIIIDENSVDLYNPKTIQAAKDSIFKLNIEFDQNLKLLKKIKHPIYSTSLKGNKNLRSITKPFCLVLGNETRGVSKKIQKLSDHLVKIKISDKIESLNVAITAGIIFYELNK